MYPRSAWGSSQTWVHFEFNRGQANCDAIGGTRAHLLPDGLVNPRPEWTLCGHVVIDGRSYLLYDLRGGYLATTAGGHGLTDGPVDSLAEAVEAVARDVSGFS